MVVFGETSESLVVVLNDVVVTDAPLVGGVESEMAEIVEGILSGLFVFWCANGLEDGVVVWGEVGERSGEEEGVFDGFGFGPGEILVVLELVTDGATDDAVDEGADVLV